MSAKRTYNIKHGRYVKRPGFVYSDVIEHKIKKGELVLLAGQQPPDRHTVQLSIMQRIRDVMEPGFSEVDKRSAEYALMYNVLRQAIADVVVGSDVERDRAIYWLTQNNNWVFNFFDIDNEYMHDQLKKHLLL